MPFDPEYPAQGVKLKSAEMRAQFAALHEDDVATNARIDNIPAGPQGPAGADGSNGNDGAPGEPFAQAVVDGVTTLDPGTPATVDVSFDGTNVHFAYGIPRGADGSNGNDGAPGEVSLQQLDDAVAGTAVNPSGIGPFGGSFSDPPTQSEMQDFAAWAESLRAAITR